MGMFHFPVKIIMGDGCLAGLADEVNRLEAGHPLIITDPGIVKAGIVDKITGHLIEKGIPYSIFEGVEPDPKIANVNEAAEAIKRKEHDLVIALGGGSSIDAAKAACICSKNEIDLREYQGIRGGYPETPLPLIAIPTTAGTGSDVSSASVIVDVEKKFKMFFKCPQIFPKVVFLDADVLAGIPSPIAAETGADALTHAFESFFNPNSSFVTEQASIGSIELIFNNLRAFVANTRNRKSAQNMLHASCLAGIAMTTAGLGLAHGLAHPVGVRGKVGHGLACALLLPHVLRFNWLADPERYVKLAPAIDWTIRLEYPMAREASIRVIEEVEDLLRDIGLPKRLSEINSSLDDRTAVVEEAYGSPLNQINPRPASRKALEDMVSKIS